MDLSQRKKDKVQAGLPSNPPKLAPSEPVGEGRAAHINRLETILDAPSSKGVVLKLYLKNLKSLNETSDCEYCGELLSQITGYLAELAEDDIYRYMGVEFIVVLEQFSEGQASDLAGEIPEHFGNVWKIRNVGCLCSAQIGLCSYPGHATVVDELIERLDLAMASTAECGLNQMSVYNSSVHAQFARHQAITMYLQTALEEHELGVRYRPTYNSKESQFTRADSYMRIFIQGIGPVGTGGFLPVTEDSGRIRAIGYYALDRADQYIANLIASDKGFDSICIPVSPVFLIQEDFIDRAGLVIEKYDILERKPALGIDDDTLSSVYLNVNITMQGLYDMGVELVMNNFGSGYAPVANILDLPVHTIKLERVFVWQLETDPKLASITGNLIQIARKLGVYIIAEGVETENQLNALNSYSCEYQQGFYCAPTVELDILKKILRTALEESQVTVEEEEMKMKR